MTDNGGPLLLSIPEAAALLGVTRSFLYESLLVPGCIESLKLGRRRLIPREAIELYIRELRERQGAAV
jgi:excisionase family DNA binding protein